MKKDWILTVGIDKFYLTQTEKDFYLSAITQGLKYVQLGDSKVLGTSFQSLIHDSVIEETKALSEGKWKCESGKWHHKSISKCHCGEVAIRLDNGEYTWVKDNSQMALDNPERITKFITE